MEAKDSKRHTDFRSLDVLSKQIGNGEDSAACGLHRNVSKFGN